MKFKILYARELKFYFSTRIYSFFIFNCVSFHFVFNSVFIVVVFKISLKENRNKRNEDEEKKNKIKHINHFDLFRFPFSIFFFCLFVYRNARSSALSNFFFLTKLIFRPNVKQQRLACRFSMIVAKGRYGA